MAAMRFASHTGALCGLIVNAGEHTGLGPITRACAELGDLEGHDRANLQALMRDIGRCGNPTNRRAGLTDADVWGTVRVALLEAGMSRNYERACQIVAGVLREPLRTV